MACSRITTAIITILLILLSTACLAEERDRIRPYTDAKGNTVYTNEHPTAAPQNNIPNNPNSSAIRPFDPMGHADNSQKPGSNSPIPSQPRPNYFSTNNNILNFFARIVAFQILMLIICFLLWLTALIDILRHEYTGSNKVVWFLTVTFIPILGPILYFTISGRHKIMSDSDIDYKESRPASSGRKHYTPPDI